MYLETVTKFAEVGAHKAEMVNERLPGFFIGAVMAGAYIGFGDIIMFTAGAHVGDAWVHLIMGVVFASALTIVIFAGSELFTGTAMYMSFALLQRKASCTNVIKVWVMCWLGNFAGAMFLALLFYAAGGGVLLGNGSNNFYTAVQAKMSASTVSLLAKGFLANWLVCLAIWMCGRTDNDAAKIALIFWPITIFVAAGFEHSVANMFTFSLALLGDTPPGITWWGAAYNLSCVTIGNLLGGVVMLGFGYWVQEAGGGHEGHFKRPPPSGR
ncbi:formate/nitrite transporter family protein [Rhizobium sp.]|uniref:formate/nitrite transporter family protein n=1 Tax=Rhizobium sp. TaxID=391 RepID=UPI0028AFDFD9